MCPGVKKEDTEKQCMFTYTQHKNPCSKDHEFNNLDRGFFADHYLTLSLLLYAKEKNSMVKASYCLKKRC